MTHGNDMLGKASIVACLYFLFGVCKSADKMTITDDTKYVCKHKVVTEEKVLTFTINLSVINPDRSHRIAVKKMDINLKKTKDYCNADLKECNANADSSKSKCYCTSQEGKLFLSTVLVDASIALNGTQLLAEQYVDEEEKPLSNATIALPIIFDAPSVSLKVAHVDIKLPTCTIAPATEPYNIEFCVQNLYEPDLSMFVHNGTAEILPTHYKGPLNCIRKTVPAGSNYKSFRFVYSDKCNRHLNIKCPFSGSSESSKLGSNALTYYFYWFLPVPIVLVVVIIASPMLYMYMKKGSCSSRDSETTTPGGSTSSRSSYDSASEE